MKITNIVYMYLALFIMMSLLVFFGGLAETLRLESFTIGDNALLSVTNTSSQPWADYTAFKSSYVYTNAPFITFLNFICSVGLLSIVFYSWRLGRMSPQMELNEIFTSSILLFMLVLYIIGIVFDYVKDIFVDQLIIVLFSEIYAGVFTFSLLTNWFFGFILFSYLLVWFSNQIKYFDNITRQ